MTDARTNLIYGIHAVESALSGNIRSLRQLLVREDKQNQRLQTLVASAKQKSIPISLVSGKELDEMFDGAHQGVIAHCDALPEYSERDLESLLGTRADPLLLVLDGVTDPHNLGACMRSAAAAGVIAVVVPKDNSAPLSPVAIKAASGGVERVPLVRVTNLARFLKSLTKNGFWITGAVGEAEKSVFQADLSGPRVLVMGSEGKGLRRLTRENCDELVQIPMAGGMESLNVSVATGVCLFEAVRQRKNG